MALSSPFHRSNNDKGIEVLGDRTPHILDRNRSHIPTGISRPFRTPYDYSYIRGDTRFVSQVPLGLRF